MLEDVLDVIPTRIRNKIEKLERKDEITQIRFRVNNKVFIYFKEDEEKLDEVITKEDIISVLRNVSNNSIYTVQKEINRGYITIKGGHRIGVAGSIVEIDNSIKNLKEISSMNIRVAHEIVGASDNLMDRIVVNGRIKNTIIASLPGLGKTTLLRDIIRNLSKKGFNVSLVDERCEVGCMYQGISQLDLGERCDVISNVEKSYGMQMAVRSLAPDVVCTDEIGSTQDVRALEYISKCGVSFIATMHANSLKDIELSNIKNLLSEGYIDNVIVLQERIGNVKTIYSNLSIKESMYVNN